VNNIPSENFTSRHVLTFISNIKMATVGTYEWGTTLSNIAYRVLKYYKVMDLTKERRPYSCRLSMKKEDGRMAGARNILMH